MFKTVDKRKKYIMVMDVETAGGLEQKLVYDLGFAIVDKKGNIIEERSFLIKEIFENKPLMTSAYYAEKVPTYLKDLEEGKHELVSFWQAREELLMMAEHYGVKTFSAYNLNFDMSALKNTTNYILSGGKSHKGNYKFLTPNFKGSEMLCIWSLACELLFSQKSFAKFAVENQLYSKAGNYRTSAEVAYRYMTNDPGFVEEHTGLEDVRIEAEILGRCLRQNKKFISGIINHPWRLVVNQHGKIVLGQ